MLLVAAFWGHAQAAPTNPPTADSKFTPAFVAVGGSSLLTITLTNDNDDSINGVGFVDNYPAPINVINDGAEPVVTNTCNAILNAPPNGTFVVASNGTIPPHDSCTIEIAVVASGAGSSVNSTGPITSANAPTGAPHSTTLTITNTPLLPAPVTTTSFAPATVANGGSSTLVVHLENASSDPITGVRFSNNDYGSGFVNVTDGPVVASDTCFGTVSADAGASGFSLQNGVVPAQSGCDVIINILATTPGVSVDSTTTAAVSANAYAGNPSTGTLTITNNLALFEPVAAVELVPSTIVVGGTAQLHIALSNFNSTAITGVGLSASLLAPLHAAIASLDPIVDNTCGGTLVADPNGTSLLLASGQILPNKVCDLRVNVTGTSAGTTDVQTSAVASSNARSGASAIASLVVNDAPLQLAPLVLKSFSPASVAVGGTSQMEVAIGNTNQIGTISGVQFKDLYPPGIANAPQDVVVSNTCGGTVIADPNGTSLELTGGSLGSLQFLPWACAVKVNVVGALAGAHVVNHVGTVSSADALPSDDAIATLDVSTDAMLPAPSIAMDFAPASILVGGTSTLTITLTNPNGSDILGAQFMDLFPNGMTEGGSGVVSNSCGGSIDEDLDHVALVNGTIPANGFCRVVVHTTASILGSLVNTISSLSSGNAETASGTSATLDVVSGSSLPAPIATKEFQPSSVSVGGQSQMVIAIANNNPFSAVTGVQLFDSYPAGMRNASIDAVVSNSCGGTVIADPDGTSLVLSNGTIQPNQQCSVRVNVVGTTANTVVHNHTGQIFSGNAATATDASADLTVSAGALLPAPSIAKTFSPPDIVAGGASQMTITLTNSNATAIHGAAFKDSYPIGMLSGQYGVIANTCGGFLDEFPDSVALADVDLPANNSCELVVQVTGNAVGSLVNETSVLSSANAAVATGATATLTVDAGPLLPAPVVTKSFAPTTLSVGGIAQMTIALENSDPANAVTGIQVWDPYPGHIANANNALVSNTCGGSVVATSGDIQMILSGGTLAPGASCAVVVNVVGTSMGNIDNHATTSSGNALASGDAIAQLVINGTPLLNRPSVTKSFNPSTVTVGEPATMTIALGNSNAGTISGVQFVDAYPAGMRNGASAVVVSNTCGGTLSAALNGTSASLSNGSIPQGGCSIVLQVVGTASGTVVNHTGAVQASNAASGLDATATLNVNGNAANSVPIAVGDALEVTPGGTTADVVGDPTQPNSLLHNDSDADPADTLTAIKLTDPAHGTLVQFNPDGTFVYQNNGSASNDSFTYKACDNHNACSPPETVSIAIGTGLNNHAPFAAGDAIGVAPGATTSALLADPNAVDSVLDNDVDIDPGDTIDAHLLVAPTHGTLLAFAANGRFTYRNDDPLATTDSVSYEACDLQGACSLAVVSITIGQNIDDQLPIAVDDALQVAPNGTTSQILGDPRAIDSVLDNDSDPDPMDTLHTGTVCNLINGSGTLSMQSDGTLVYQNSAAVTTDLCFHETCDQLGACVTSRVTVTVDAGALDQPPVAMDDAIEVAPNGTTSAIVGDPNVPASVLDNDTDADDAHATLTAHLIGAPVSGSVSIDPDGTFTYQNTDPAASTDAFVYEACDPSQACTSATVSVTINQQAPAVVCRLPTQVGAVGSSVSIDLATLFEAPLGTSLAYDATNLPPSLSLVGALLSGTLQASDVGGSPFLSTLSATAGGASASQNVLFEVVPSGDILLRNGYDLGDPNQRCQ